MARKKPSQLHRAIKLVLELRSENSESMRKLKDRMFEVDLRYHRACVAHLEKCNEEVKKCKASGKPPILDNVEPPVVLAQTEQAVAYLASTFLSKNAMFPLVGKPDIQPVLEDVESLLISYADEHQWRAEDIAGLRDAVKYNFDATEIQWQTNSGTEGVTPSPFSGYDEGITFRSLPMYNCSWDTECPLHRMQQEGTYFEHHQFISSRRIKILLSLENVDHLTSVGKSVRDMSVSVETTDHSVMNPLTSIDDITTKLNGAYVSSDNWSSIYEEYSNILGVADSSKNYRNIKAVKYTVAYVKATAKEVGSPMEVGNPLNNYKLIFVNDGKLLYKEKLTIPMFNVVIGTGIIDKLGNTRSLVDSVIGFQDMAGKLLRSKLSLSRNEVHDHGIFNPRYVSSADINSPVDAKKIPLRKSAWHDPDALRKAYLPIAVNNTSSNDLIGDANFLMNNMANDATGISEFRRSPVRGNKSVGQFQLESNAADGRMSLFAMTMEGSRYSKFKKIIKILLLTHRPNSDVIQWDQLANVLNFRLTDGLTDLGILGEANALEAFTNLAGQQPQFAPMVGEILDYVLMLRSNFKMSNFAREQAQQPPQVEEALPSEEPGLNDEVQLPDVTT